VERAPLPYAHRAHARCAQPQAGWTREQDRSRSLGTRPSRLGLGPKGDGAGAWSCSPHRSSAAASASGSGALAAGSPSSAAWLRPWAPSAPPAGPGAAAGAGGALLASGPSAPPPALRSAPRAAPPASALTVVPPLAGCHAPPSGSAASPRASTSRRCGCAPADTACLAREAAQPPGTPLPGSSAPGSAARSLGPAPSPDASRSPRQSNSMTAAEPMRP